MNRYAPELALVAGGLLGSVFGGFVLFSVGEFYSAAIVAVLCCYPFAAYAIRTDDDPTTVLLPWLVTTVAGLMAVGVVFDVLRLFSPTLGSLLFGILLGLVVFLPVATYAVQYGSPPNWFTPQRVGITATALSVGLLISGLTTGEAVSGSISAVLVFVSGTVFAARSTGRRRKRLVPIAGFVLAGGLLTVGSVSGGPLDPWVAAALGAVFGPLLSVALTEPPHK